MRYIFFLLALFFTNLEAKNQPNFVLILIDDLGLTDLEAFGGEIDTPNINFLATLNLFLAGIVLGIYYIHKSNLWLPIGMHLTWNFFQGPVFGFEVSGIEAESIINQSVSGSDLLTGGAFGFEGSLLCTFAIVLMILYLDKKYK